MISRDKLKVQLKIPAKIMLSGEYAVMEGFSSLSMALNKYIRIELCGENEEGIKVSSSLWKESFSFNSSFDFPKEDLLFSSLSKALDVFPCKGFSFSVSNDFSVTSGFGSSSALRLGIYYAFYLYHKALKGEQDFSDPFPWKLAERAFSDQLLYQSKASGYDMITQKEGGLIHFKRKDTWPTEFKKISLNNSLLKDNVHIFVGGKGAPTKKIMTGTAAWLEASGVKSHFFDLSEKLSASFLGFLKEGNRSQRKALISSMSKQRKLMSESPFFPIDIERVLMTLPGFDETWSYKTTGSGGEDALLFFGSLQDIAIAEKALSQFFWSRDNWEIERKGMTGNLSLGEKEYVF